MYRPYYGLTDSPFAITPDPRFVFLSDRHRDALAHLVYGIGQGGSGGFVQLTGEVGTGKTTLSRLLLEQLPAGTHVALVLNPRMAPIELLETLCEELHVEVADVRGSLKGLVDRLNRYLLDVHARGERAVVILDEAQDLSVEALEQVRLLSNLETPTQKLLQIVLLGQPELRDLLAKPELRQLAQRITARYHLTPLDAGETGAYVRHRLAVAGARRTPFSRLGLAALHRRAQGVPRLINLIADRALLAGYVADEPSVGERLVERAADEVLGRASSRRLRALVATAVLAAVVALGYAAWRWRQSQPTPPAPIAAAPAAPAKVEVTLPEQLASAEAAARDPVWPHYLALWQANEVPAGDGLRCPPRLVPGLYCALGRSNLGRLAALGRPVLLALPIRDRAPIVLLSGLDERRARIDAGPSAITVSRTELDRHWRGEYLALWRAPPGLPERIRVGDAGPAVDWVRAMLGREVVAGAAFDVELESAVRTLQIEYGGQADGIVGPDTQFLLAAHLPGGPQLAAVAE